MMSVFYSALDDYRLGGSEEAPKPHVEYYTKDRLPWVKPLEGADQLKTR